MLKGGWLNENRFRVERPESWTKSFQQNGLNKFKFCNKLRLVFLSKAFPFFPAIHPVCAFAQSGFIYLPISAVVREAIFLQITSF